MVKNTQAKTIWDTDNLGYTEGKTHSIYFLWDLKPCNVADIFLHTFQRNVLPPFPSSLCVFVAR
jgi:hypothetical protein